MRSMCAVREKVLDRLLRTITAACTAPLPGDLIAQTCASRSSWIVTVPAQCHVLVLEVIGLRLPLI